MATYMQHKTGTPDQMVAKIVDLYKKLDNLNANPEATKRQIGAAAAQISKARYNHSEAIDAINYKNNPGTDRFERMEESSKEARDIIIAAVMAAGRANADY